ncbi:hypothetical protein C900_04825 [Fulvivirga imtechensis AK7]|uniref:Outer membrane protein beta-barrel domain-containing protein n=1 Tax=Fulvivirga imtechensis AK7 TaxID=1237149 RepID=L8JLA8_9BACT|nr:outer membrane beta-barrel protein [Fulvivirga imtechensis]ELR69600.1 hypothetical protein C900_04825 [Fulvivirga imtechensis AK7]
MRIVKAYCVLILFFVLTFKGFAQLEKGHFMVGGNISFEKSKTELPQNGPNVSDHKQLTFSIDPDISYFLADNLALGVVTPFSYSKNSNSMQDQASKTYSVGPKLRYYFPSGRWAIFPEVSYTIGWNTTEGSIFSPDVGEVIEAKAKGNTSMFSGGLGGAYFINDHVAIEGVLFYKKYQLDYEENFFTDVDISSFNFKAGLQFFL